jgi:hypothetical protein
MRTLIAYVLVAFATFGLGLAANGGRRLILRNEKPTPCVEAKSSTDPVVQSKAVAAKSNDPCYEPLQVVKTKWMIRSIPFEVIKACVKADQAKPQPLIDSRTAKGFLRSFTDQ